MTFWRTFTARQRIRGAPCRAWLAGSSGRGVVVLETGLGPAAMGSAVRWVLGEPDLGSGPYRPPFLILAGFSGALLPGRPVGHLLLATEVVDQHGRRWPAPWPGEREGAPERGRVLTADALVVDPAAKRELGARHGAVAVDMESAAAAHLCHERGVPFGCLRAVSDDDGTPLSPELVGLLRAGRPSPLAVIATLARRPKVAAELWALTANTRIAARQLASGLGTLLGSAP